MMIGRNRFNVYLLLLLAGLLAGGCRTAESKQKKELSILRVHVEANPGWTDRTVTVSLPRTNSVSVTVEKDPFLTEADVKEARVVDVAGGFDLQIQFDQEGTWLLEQYSASNNGRHFVIFASFGEKLKLSRWLAAPKIVHLIPNGVLLFTPDATREEAGQIALGLNNVAKKTQKDSKW